MKFLSIFWIALLFFVPHVANASPPTITYRLWTSTANGCTVADESAGLYDTRGVGIGFLSGQLGTIRLYCPITLNEYGAEYTGVGFSYNNPGASSTLSVYFRQVADGSNSASTICSSSWTSTGAGQDYCSVTPATFPTTMNYFVEIDLTRSSVSVDPEIYSVYLYY